MMTATAIRSSTLDAHDSVVLGGIAKAQLHVGDFHVV